MFEFGFMVNDMVVLMVYWVNGSLVVIVIMVEEGFVYEFFEVDSYWLC